MWIIRFPPRLRDLLRTRRPRALRRGTPTFRPRLEELEGRAVPSTVTWDGGGGTPNWSDRFNWVNDVGPVSGDDLVFPDGAARVTNANDLAGGMLINSLTFSGVDYTISGGSSNVLNLGPSGIVNSVRFAPNSTVRFGTNSYNGPIQLDGARPIEVSGLTDLALGGVLSGSGGITKSGDRVLTLNGPGANTYTGTTEVRSGLLDLDKENATGPTIAVPGDLQIVSGFDSDSVVRLLHDNQIADTATVTVTKSTNSAAKLNLLGSPDTIGALNLTGGRVENVGVLTLNGDVTAQGFTLNPFNPNAFTPAEILGGTLALGTGTRRFTVNETPGSTGIDLSVGAHISGGILIKEAAGVMGVTSTSIIGRAEVNAGTFALFDDLTGSVLLRDNGTLGGTGHVIGSVSVQSSPARTVDDGGPGFSTTGLGWVTIPGQGYAHHVASAVPTVFPQTATWDFTGLTPGLYRVFATWPGDASHTSAAPYRIFDNTALRATVVIDQERAPAGGPHDGGVVFQQLAGTFDIHSGRLTVQLSSQVAMEADGASVIADAVRIERLAGILGPGGGPKGGNPVGTLSADNVTLGLGSTYLVDFASTPAGTNTADQLIVAGSFLKPGPVALSGALLALSATSFNPPAPGTGYRILIPDTSTGAFSNLPNDGDTIEMVAGGQRHIFTINYHGGGRNDVDLAYQNTATQVSELELSPDVIDEGQRVTLRGALTDPNRGDVLSLRVDWGDGSVQTFRDLGTRPFHFTHVYADNSPAGVPFLVRAEWFDQHGAGNFRKLFVTVRNVPPRLFLVGAEVIRAGNVMGHTGRFTDPGADTWRATVDYGDDSGVQPLVVRPGKELLFAHRYTRPGKYRVTVTVFDDDGGLTTDSFLVIVLPHL